MSRGLTRRELLKFAVIAAGGHFIPWSRTDGICTPLPDVAIARGPSPAQITQAAIEALGGMSRFVSRGDIVLVKPNIAWDRDPQLAATTNPQVVAELVRLCLEAGAKEVRVFDHTCEDPRRCYVTSGVMAAAKGAGAKVSYVEERKFRRIDIKGEALKSWEVYQDAVEVDKIINCPILKHHSLARLTMGMKNLMGLVGGERSRLHWHLAEAIVDLASFFKPTLVVLDAVRILTANGPQGGSPKYVRKLDTVVAGKDQVAVDALGARLFGINPAELAHLSRAVTRGLGRLDLSRIRIKEV